MACLRLLAPRVSGHSLAKKVLSGDDAKHSNHLAALGTKN